LLSRFHGEGKQTTLLKGMEWPRRNVDYYLCEKFNELHNDSYQGIGFSHAVWKQRIQFRADKAQLPMS